MLIFIILQGIVIIAALLFIKSGINKLVEKNNNLEYELTQLKKKHSDLKNELYLNFEKEM